VASNATPLAHSARRGASEQSYRDHVGNVRRFAAKFAREAAAHSAKWRESFQAVLELAAAYHDLGKLDEIFQDILHRNRANREGFNHVEAGTAHLLNLKQGEAALCCFAHHIGLPSLPKEKARGEGRLFLRDEDQLSGIGKSSWERSDDFLDHYLTQHHAIFAPQLAGRSVKFSGLVRRLVLSCLVDGDHSDTAQHYKEERKFDGPPLRAPERLQALDRYVESLKSMQLPKSDQEKARLKLRREIYAACRNRALQPSERIVACDSPVGTGKTTAVMAHLLRMAIERNLRRVFVVLPFTNIIDQSVEIYRRALVLPGEDPESVVAAHHHRVEFAGEDWRDLRQLAQRWEAPIVVTTAVQFFEALAANQTVPLRKLHQVPGSAIFVDEAHAAMPAPIWPQQWRWLRELCDDWNCHVVLASGSLSRFWELTDFVPAQEQRTVPELVGESLRADAAGFEAKRVWLKTRPQPLPLPDLADFIAAKPGPRLVILNTVQSAAILAHHLRYARNQGTDVEHLSTALCPADREITLRRVKENLCSDRRDWTLVATSCVEAGVDFSFRTAFRESCGLTNLLQTAGRVSRGGEYPDAEVWDFRHDESGFLNLHPHFKTARKVLGDLFVEHGANLGPQHSTEALQREINASFGEPESLAARITTAERDGDYPQVAQDCRLITADTHTVLVNQELIARFLTFDPQQFPTPREVMRHSVQVWSNKLRDLPVTRTLGFGEELAGIQPDCYDGFLGYMKGLIPLLEAQRSGGFIL
jgi:CRISPR-associated endonuclease/helicase Cas3